MRYMLFAGSHYYPSGGMNDWYATCEELSDVHETIKNLNTREYDWYQIFDTEERTFTRGSI